MTKTPKVRAIAVSAMMFLDFGAVSAVATTGSAAATYYVATTGSDTTGDGSISNPWRNIRKGVIMMAANDTLLIRGGTYADDGFYVLSDFKSGTGGNYTTVKNYPGETVIYRSTYNHHGVLIQDKTNLWLEGWSVDATQLPTGDALKITTVGTPIGGNIVITNMNFWGAPHGHGILTSGIDARLGVLITHCSFYTNGWNARGEAAQHQIYIQDSNVTVENCYIEGVMNADGGGWGIHLYNSDCINNVYRGNFITNAPAGGILANSLRGTNCLIYNNIVVACSAGIELRKISNALVLNNTCVSNSVNIRLDASTNIWVENNICTGGTLASPGGIDVFNHSDTVFVHNNLGYSNQYSDFRIYSAHNVTTNGNYFNKCDIGGVTTVGYGLDAMFLNAAAGDFKLKTGSSAIGAGRAQTTFSRDYNGNTRTGWDIGACDYRIPPPSEFRTLEP